MQNFNRDSTNPKDLQAPSSEHDPEHLPMRLRDPHQ